VALSLAITGANSAVGSALLRQVVGRADIEAVGIVRRPDALAAVPDGPAVRGAVARYDDAAALGAALDGAGCVVHLAGILFESRTTRYEDANVGTTRALVDAARGAGVRRVVFISSIGADPDSPNGYFRSKGEAERVVTASGMAATIIRTPLLLGPATAGGRALVAAASRPTVRTLGGGAHTLRPLDVDDLCLAILHAAAEPASGIALHDLVGPTPITHRALLERMAALLGHQISVRATPIWLARLGASVAGLCRTGGMTPAVIDVITSSESVAHNADRDLGLTLTPLQDTLRTLVP